MTNKKKTKEIPGLAKGNWKAVATEEGACCSRGCRCPWKCDKRI